MCALPLFISYDEDLDWLEAAPYGVVMDRQGSGRWRGVSDLFGFFLDAPGGDVAGFKIVEFSAFDPEDEDVAEIFAPPRFDAPALGLREATAGEIALAAPSLLGGRSTIDRVFFTRAIGASGAAALRHWRAALQAGNPMAHYGAGYTLLDLGEAHAAYRHLRHYTELVACDAWAWCYRGRAAAAMGDLPEAVASWRTALRIEQAGGEESEARELLDALGEPHA